MRKVKKPRIRFGKGGKYTALFSNLGCDSTNEFYLLATYISKNKNPAGHISLSEEKADELLKKKNSNWKYVSYKEAVP